MGLIGALDVGGTHVTAALVDPESRTVSERIRRSVDSNASADAILDNYAAAASDLESSELTTWGIAMPGPFDYENGIGLFHGVGKYEALYNFDVRTALAERLGTSPSSLRFVNDADAFSLGEALRRDIPRLVGITLGTGIGSGWIADGRPCADGPGVPAGGRINDPNVPGSDIENHISRRLIREQYAVRTGEELDVHEITRRARAGDKAAIAVLSTAFGALGAELGPRLRDFEADLLVLCGSMAASWDLFGPWFVAGSPVLLPRTAVSEDPEASTLLGAALSAVTSYR